LVDADPSNNFDLFRVNENFSNTRLTLDFIPNSWTTDDGAASPAYTLSCDVRSGVTIANADIEIGPVVMKGPFFNLEELQLLPLENPANGSTLLASVAVGVDEASLKFGGDSPKVKTAVTKLLGTFDIDSVVSPVGDAASTGSFRIRADKIEVEVKDIVKAEATGIYINYDPVKDKNHDGTVSEAEQTAYNQQEIVRVDSATVTIPKINLTGALSPYTRPGLGIDPNTGQLIPGTTIPGLSVRNDGFRLGEAKLTYNDTLKFGSVLELTNVGAGVQDFGVTFGSSIDFDGSVFIAADGAKLFPGKKFAMTLTDSPSDPDSEAVRATLKFTDNEPSGFAFK
ncbi:MAG TPA: hypothetical protein PLV92_30235, partial [Pirellulaceae bacterium]|nr:hypothetical protein [Pirellulaceae bacterium]